MANATVQIRRWTGASGSETKTDVTGINSRLNAYDGHSTADTTYPIKIPSSGTNYSYWGSFRLYVSANASAHTLDNVKWYTQDGTNNFTTDVGLNVGTTNSYTQATGTSGETGNASSVATTNAFTYTSSNMLTVTTSSTTSASVDLGDFVVLQITVGSSAVAGPTGQETMVFQYEES